MRSLLIAITVIFASFTVSADALSDKVAGGGKPSLGFATAVQGSRFYFIFFY